MNYAIFDIDGTISQRGEPISPAMANALLAARQHHQLVFASARPVRDMLPLLPAELHDALMIGCNGGMAWQQGAFLFSDKFAAGVARQVIGWLDEMQAAYVMESHWHYAFSAVAHPFHDYVRSLNTTQAPCAGEVVEAEGINKLLILELALREPLLAYLAQHQLPSVEKLHRFDDCFDLMPGKTDKVNALDRLAIMPEQAIVFGNDLNDQAMLARAGHAVVVGSFSPATPPHQRVAFAQVPATIHSLLKHRA